MTLIYPKAIWNPLLHIIPVNLTVPPEALFAVEPRVSSVTGIVSLVEVHVISLENGPLPLLLIPNAVFNALKDVTPVPPLAIGNVPVTPGRGEAANVLAAEVEPRFTNIDGLEVIPVPPLATGKVPEVILLAAWL